MLEIRPNCERCDKKLAPDSTDAMICTFECTFCEKCVDEILLNVCPNCGGGFEKRPIRPQVELKKYPASTIKVLKEIDLDKYNKIQEKLKNISPQNR